VVLALGESNSKTIDANQKSRLLYDKTTQYPAGLEIRVNRPDATPDDSDYTQIF